MKHGEVSGTLIWTSIFRNWCYRLRGLVVRGNPDMSAEQIHVFFKGTVQGVGFRFTAERISRDYQVTGYVRNLPDGRVELLAEGDGGVIQAFLEAVQNRMTGYITDTEVHRSPATGQYSGFRIAF